MCGHASPNGPDKVRVKAGKYYNYKPQPFPGTKRTRKQTKPNKSKSNKRTKNTKLSFLQVR